MGSCECWLMFSNGGLQWRHLTQPQLSPALCHSMCKTLYSLCHCCNYFIWVTYNAKVVWIIGTLTPVNSLGGTSDSWRTLLPASINSRTWTWHSRRTHGTSFLFYFIRIIPNLSTLCFSEKSHSFLSNNILHYITIFYINKFFLTPTLRLNVTSDRVKWTFSAGWSLLVPRQKSMILLILLIASIFS